ncbi:hypothetical protein CY34DRAFT_33440, partial [Suillus luteus UH-Slu-Lm8-n1]
WQEYEEAALLDFLTQKLSTCGDRVNFPVSTWATAAQYVNTCALPPGKMHATRNAQSCKNKWTYLKAGYNHVYIKNTSGLSWSDADGVGVSNETKHIWEQIVKVSTSLYLHVCAKPFRNKGFPHFETIDEMM